MSINIIASWPAAIVAVADRRLTDFVSKKIRTNRSTKITVFKCSDAHGVVVYNGIGMDDDRLTPSDWLLELAANKFFDGDLEDLLEGVKRDLEMRLHKFRANYGAKKARHTFSFAVWHNGQSEIYHLTNYESLNGENSLEGSEFVKIIPLLPIAQSPIQIVVTGTMPPKADVKAVCDTIKTKSTNYVVARCIKLVRDVAYRQGRARGLVGASAQWAIVGPNRDEVWCGLDVVGGRIAQEPPNIINIQANSHVAGTMNVAFGDAEGKMMFKDAYAYAVTEDGSKIDIAHYDPAKKKVVFSEPTCGLCGSPWPASHLFCEVCLYELHHVRGKKQRRRKMR